MKEMNVNRNEKKVNPIEKRNNREGKKWKTNGREKIRGRRTDSKAEKS